MFELWYAITALMLAMYVALDGFDLGAGILSPLVARTDSSGGRCSPPSGPTGMATRSGCSPRGALFVAFPRVLASGLSGFYFAIVLVLWCLLGRGIAIEFRSHVTDPLWRSAWDFVFAAASTLLAVFFGAAFGNLMRGVPLDKDGWFSLVLFTDFTARDPVGILDWYTILTGVFALVALAAHGALFLAWKTEGPVHERSDRLARRLWIAVAVLWPIVTIASNGVNPALFPGMARRWLAALAVALAVGGLIAIFVGLRRQRGLGAFLGSCAFLLGTIGASAASYFPVMLLATGGEALSITAYMGGADERASARRCAGSSSGFRSPGVPRRGVPLHRGNAVAARDGDGH
jgi:cytochrome d ubiquinol oxidase subunit II